MLMLHLIFYFSPLFQTVGRERIHAAVLPRSPVLLHWIGAVAYDILRLYPTKKKKSTEQNENKMNEYSFIRGKNHKRQ